MADSWRVVGTLALLGLVCEGAAAIVFRFWPNPAPLAMELDAAYCKANALGVSCAFTNTARVPTAGTCAVVSFAPKLPGHKVVSAPALCSGPVGPRETKIVSLDLGWHVVDACANAQGGLDFEACEMRIDGVP